jgi:hypothetical protein
MLGCLAALIAAPGCRRVAPAGTDTVPYGASGAAGLLDDRNPRWSHDGSRIAFVRVYRDRREQLCLMDARTGRVTPLLEPELVHPDREYAGSLDRYSSPDTIAWSPDDQSIAFERIEWFHFDDGERLPGTGLWTLNLRTGHAAPLATHPRHYALGFYYYHDPAWSPDGRRVAFVGEGLNGQRVLFVRTLGAQRADGVPAAFDARSDSDWPVWAGRTVGSAAGCSLAYRHGIRATIAVPPTETIRIVTPGGFEERSNGEVCRITAQTLAAALPPYGRGAVIPRICHPVWSPDAGSLALDVSPDPLDASRATLWVVGPAASAARMVAGGDGHGYIAPVWIGGETLGALSPRSDGYAVVTVRIRTGAVTVLGTIPTADCDWSPDRRTIAYACCAAGAGCRPECGIRLFHTGLKQL